MTGSSQAMIPAKRAYDASTWALEKDENGIPKRDMTLQHERCVFQLLKKHYSRYTLEKVTEITGTPEDDLEKVYKAYGSTGAPDKAGTELYAMGWTPAYSRCSEHSRHVHHPVPSRKYGYCRWRNQCPARRVECSGLH